ncbi:glycoside hydrolase [Paramyrothecium foliicola]|nr:glycoside hydrolase [Paramyrothecium foliicola]
MMYGSWDEESDWIGPHIYAYTNLTVIKNALNLLKRNDVPPNQGQGGYMSYSDIAYTCDKWNPKVITDRKDAIKYFRYDENQWVSSDDQETLKWKVEFANAEGLPGLFVWVITQDTIQNSLLDAALQSKSLGAFEEGNGVHSGADLIDTASPDQCFITSRNTPERHFCCPISAAFNPRQCQWQADKSGSTCSNELKCKEGEKKRANHNWFRNDKGVQESCSGGTQADYCCKAETANGCSWSKDCYKLGSTILPCEVGTQPIDTVNLISSIGAKTCDVFSSWVNMLCCDISLQPKCRWLGEEKDRCRAECRSDEVDMGRHRWRGGTDCLDPKSPANIHNSDQDKGYGPQGCLLCCTKDSDFNIDVDVDGGSDSLHPNDNTLGWHIMTGSPDEIASIRKRDGSHWEVYGCDPEHLEGSEDHNCDDIRMGGVADTVLEMPGECGPGKYALAISLEPLHKAEDGTKLHQRVKRGLPEGAQVYELTFNYGFHRLQGRAKSHRDLEAMEHKVKHKHGNDWKRYLDHTWREDRRYTPPEKLHELHERWLGNDKYTLLDQRLEKLFTYNLIDEVKDCFIAGQPVHIEAHLYAKLIANIQTSSVVPLIGKLSDLKSFRHSYLNFRNKGDILALIVFKALGELRIPYMEETLLADKTAWQPGVAVIGASFIAPGILTIGPESKVTASIKGKLSVEADARVNLRIAERDYSQRYPAPDDKFEDNKEHPKISTRSTKNADGDGPMAIEWNVQAEGVIKLHVWVLPRVSLTPSLILTLHALASSSIISLGIDFNPSLAIPGVSSTVFSKSLDHKWSIMAKEASNMIIECPSGFSLLTRALRIHLRNEWLQE